MEAVDRIRQDCDIVLKITPAGAKGEEGNFFSRDIGGTKLDMKAFTLMCSQMAIILRAGIPISRTVHLIADKTTDKNLKKILTNVASDVESGRSISASFEERGGKLLPATFIETVRAGEESGSLVYNSNQVSFNNNNTTLTSTDLQSAIDELYNKCSNVPAVGSCPEGYECTQLNKVTYNANGGSFTGGSTTNDVYYSVVDNGVIEKISKTSNVDDEGNKTGYMPEATNGITDTVTIEGADSLEVEITYQTYNSSASYVYVRNAAGTNVSSKLYGQTKTTTTVTVTGDTAKIYFYNSQTSSRYNNYYGYYAKIKGKKNNEYIKEIIKTKEEGEYTIPTNQNTQLEFAGWTENADGSGALYRSEQEVMDSLDTENRSVVLYARFVIPTCKRATTLHTETCTYTSTSGGYCSADGYYTSGSQGTKKIKYGQRGTTGTLTSGDAIDCDVNGDGTYDSETERFYYVSDYFDTSSNSFDSNYATFIYYSNTTSGTASTDNVAWYSYSNNTIIGPITAMAQLPKTTGTNAWRDDLLKTRTRNILKGNSETSVTSTAKSNFSYEGYAARLLTIQELYSGCYDGSHSITSISDGGLSYKCKYLMERTKYATNSYETIGPWLESVSSSDSAWSVNSYYRRVYGDSTSSSSNYGARPAIEVLKSYVSY